MADHRLVTARRCYTVALGAARHARRQISCVRKIVKLTSRKIEVQSIDGSRRRKDARNRRVALGKEKKKRKNEEKQSGAQIRNNETISIPPPPPLRRSCVERSERPRVKDQSVTLYVSVFRRRNNLFICATINDVCRREADK